MYDTGGKDFWLFACCVDRVRREVTPVGQREPVRSFNADFRNRWRCLPVGFPFFRKKISNPELGTTRKNISEPGIPGSNPELGTIRKFFRIPTRNPEIFRVPTRNPEIISGFQPGTRKFFWVPTRNPEIFPGSNPEPGNFSGFQPGTRKFFWVPTRNPLRRKTLDLTSLKGISST